MKHKTIFELGLLALFLLSELGLCCLSFCCFIPLSETQIFYVSSTTSQVVATFFGLTLVGYEFVENKLRIESEGEETKAEANKAAIGYYHLMLRFAAVLSMLSIICSVYNMTLGMNEKTINGFVDRFVLNNSVALSIAAIVFITIFMFAAISSSLIQIFSRWELDDMYKDAQNDRQGSIEDFIRLYAAVERSVREAYVAALEAGLVAGYGYRHKSMVAMSRVLRDIEAISPECVRGLTELQRYRNLLFHNVDGANGMQVSLEACEKAEELKKMVDEDLAVFKRNYDAPQD